jgi:hypothetical protein
MGATLYSRDCRCQFRRPSSYSLTHAELAAHIRSLRRQGWQSWEVRVRFDTGTVSDAA